jgi:hypothetical protein
MHHARNDCYRKHLYIFTENLIWILFISGCCQVLEWI